MTRGGVLLLGAMVERYIIGDTPGFKIRTHAIRSLRREKKILVKVVRPPGLRDCACVSEPSKRGQDVLCTTLNLAVRQFAERCGSGTPEKTPETEISAKGYGKYLD